MIDVLFDSIVSNYRATSRRLVMCSCSHDREAVVRPLRQPMRERYFLERGREQRSLQPVQRGGPIAIGGLEFGLDR
jgi:hypothetical protein